MNASMNESMNTAAAPAAAPATQEPPCGCDGLRPPPGAGRRAGELHDRVSSHFEGRGGGVQEGVGTVSFAVWQRHASTFGGSAGNLGSPAWPFPW